MAEPDVGSDEPLFAYRQLAGDVPSAFAKDAASAIASSDSAVGMHSGMLYVFDHALKLVKRLRPHGATIFDLKLDPGGLYVATASMDGKVAILSLSSAETYIQDLKRPVRSVALEPGFARKNAHQFISGGLAGVLTLHERGWLGQKEHVLHSGDGAIWAIEWRGRYVAWASDAGVRVLDFSTQQRLAFLPRGADEPRPELFRCNMQWASDARLLVGWANTVSVVAFGNERGQVRAEVTDILQVDCTIAGLSPWNKDFVILGLPDGLDDSQHVSDGPSGGFPELRVISDQGEELSSDALDVDRSSRLRCDDYRLARHQSGFLILSPTRVVSARPRSPMERVDWLASNKRFDEALALARDSPTVDQQTVAEIGRALMLDLIASGRYEAAAQRASQLLGRDAKAWEDWIFFLAEKGRDIAGEVPVEAPRLSHVAYEIVLLHLLQNDPEAMLRTLRTWPADIYDIAAVASAVEDRAARDRSDAVVRCLAELYVRANLPAKALRAFLEVKDRRAFDLIRSHNLYTDVRDRALLLMELDAPSPAGDAHLPPPHSVAVELLVEHTYSIPVPRVVDQLHDHPLMLYRYLDALADKDVTLTSDFADTLVDLDLVREMVFLQGKMGNNKKALRIIIDRLGSVEEAIAFTKDRNDVELWEDLLAYAESRPHFIKALLRNVGSEVDPVRLVRRIRNGLRIPGLKRALIEILQDFNLQLALVTGCHVVVAQEALALSTTLRAGMSRGVLVAGQSVCESCRDPLALRPWALLTLGHPIHLSCQQELTSRRTKGSKAAVLAAAA